MSGIRISFVLASYNGAVFIKEQLASILAVIGSRDEIVISDDGSTDSTLEQVSALDDVRIRVLPAGERLGYQANFARAVAASKGKYVFFSDQDDICLPARVPLSLAALQKSACVCGDAVVVNEVLSPLYESHFAHRRARFSVGWLIARPSVIGATLACRRDFLFANLPFPHGVPHDMWLSVQAARGKRLAVVREPFILYRRHKDVVSSTSAVSRRPLLMRLAERGRLLISMIHLTVKAHRHG